MAIDHDEMLHTFGNLTLTGYNAELGNRSFTDKKRELENTHIELNRWILEQHQWTRAQIEERALTLFKRLYSSGLDLQEMGCRDQVLAERQNVNYCYAIYSVIV